jgi:hypothetical protein
MPVQCLAAETKLFAQISDDRASLAHRGLGEAQLGGRHLRLASAVAPAGARGGESRDRALPDQLALELGERREDAEHQLAGGGRGVDRGALPGEHPQADAACIEVVHDVDEVTQVAAESIEFPDDEGVAGPQRFETCVEAGPVVFLAARGVTVNVALGDAGSGESVFLQIEYLRTVSFRDAHVADERGEHGTPQTVVCGATRFRAAFAGFHITK